jgi:TonB-dependent receptor
MRVFWKIAAVVVMSFVMVSAPLAQGRETGTVTGRVLDASRGEPLPGAQVKVDGTPLTVATDRGGMFRLTGVPTGPQVVVVTYLGRLDARIDVVVTNGTPVDITVKLDSDYKYSERVTVTGEAIQEGQARALNQQRTALNITNIVSADQIGSFPDPNAAEAASRIPGISIARDQGEGRYILIRGTEARLNATMIDGERVPAPEGGVRQVQMDAIPADQLQAIEVSKALTPDMDADAIGGAVNLVTKQALAKPTVLFSASGGYNALQRSYDQQLFSGTAGRRFSNGRFGLLAGFSASRLTRGSENFEAEYDEGYLADLQLRDYQISRDRYGFNLSADVRASDNSAFTLRAIVNRFEDYEVNNRIRFRPPNRRIEHVLKNRNQTDDIRSVLAGGQHVFGSTTVDYRASWGLGRESQPDRLDTIFRQSNIDFNPNVSPTFIDPDNIQPNPSSNNASVARLNAWETEIFDTEDRDITGSFNVRMPLSTSSSNATFLKFGMKVRDKSKFRTLEAGSASPASTVLFPALEDPSFDNSRFLEFFPAGYDPFPGINPSATRAAFEALPAGRYELDRAADGEAYNASELVTAGYVMAELFLGPKMMLLPGLRFESTNIDYTGYRVLFDEDGEYVSTTPETGSDSHTFALPGLHFRYALTDDTNLRLAYSRTMARPNYVDLVPYEVILQEDGDVSRGNPALEPTISDNVDVMIERYFKSVGVISGGFFYKRLNNYIYVFRSQEQIFGDVYTVTQPQNGESASLWGLELALQNQLRFLPSPFDGLGLYANSTWTDSTAEFPDRSGTARLPGQSAHVGNLSVWFEKYGFSARASWNFHGQYIDEVGSTSADDRFYDNHTQVDLNFSQRLSRNVLVYVDFLNITNAPLRYYFGVPDRPSQEEYYRGWTMFGVKFNW